ncbi:MAG: AAA family ATPase [Campylobacterota bacterium]|nr:AAA family ATPase [Campylobacterota bacterium]
MKILSLKSLNINSLKGKTEIDFDELTKESALFAITGPTGSGKSSILDIISCALYGRTVRLKNPNDLMSRHTGETYCEVEFEIKGRLYRSSWTQKRARKKHDGAFQTAKMELTDLQENKILALKSREVPKKIEELSGLDFGRFTQSMLLAQGGFDAFLKADEKERSILLEKITGTQIYAEISMAVFEKHRGFVQEIEQTQKVLQSIELLTDEVLQDKEKLLAYNIAQKRKTDKELKELTLSLNWVQRVSQLIGECKRYEEEFQDSTRLKKEHKNSFIQLDLANKALNVSAVFTSYTQLQKSIGRDEISSTNFAQELKTLDKEIKSKDMEYSVLKKEFEKEDAEFEVQNQKLKEVREIQTKENQDTQRIKKESSLLKTKEKNLQKLTKALALLVDKYAEIQIQIDTQNSYILQNAIDEKLLSIIGAVEQNIKLYKEEEKLLILNQKELDELSIRIDENATSNTQVVLEKSIVEIKKHIETLRDKKTKEQLLKKYEEDRASLLEGEECYLCGSKEHPYALLHVEVNIDETQSLIVSQSKELEKQEKALNSFNVAHEKYNTLHEQLTITLKARKERVDGLLKSLEQHYKEFGEDLHVESLDTQYDMLLKRKNLYLKALDTLKALELKFNLYKLDKKESETKIVSIKEEISALLKSLKELELSVAEFSCSRIKRLNVADIDSYEKEITTKYKMAQKRVQLCKTVLDESKVKSKERLSNKKSLDIKIAQGEQTLHLLKNELDELYEKNGFKDAQELEDATLTTPQREKLATLCKGIEDKLKQSQTLKIKSEKELKEHQLKPLSDRSLQELENLQSLLEQKADALQESIGSDKKELELNQENSDKYKERIESLQKQKESFKVWVKLNELVGSADGAKFKKFAQGITLEQLINLANQHLNILSSRYTLIRNQDKLLELEVIDAFQGDVIRSVGTLSGGESFIVSLSLALGLSELASQKIAIDSLFLDEGFGTLDEESLETALNALNLLQSGGKMIGVISHVEALKERIPLQIKVIPNGDGTSFVE